MSAYRRHQDQVFGEPEDQPVAAVVERRIGNEFYQADDPDREESLPDERDIRQEASETLQGAAGPAQDPQDHDVPEPLQDAPCQYKKLKNDRVLPPAAQFDAQRKAHQHAVQNDQAGRTDPVERVQQVPVLRRICLHHPQLMCELRKFQPHGDQSRHGSEADQQHEVERHLRVPTRLHFSVRSPVSAAPQQIDEADRVDGDAAGDLQVPVLDLDRARLQSDVHRPVHADDRRHQRCQEHQHFQRYTAQQLVVIHRFPSKTTLLPIPGPVLR